MTTNIGDIRQAHAAATQGPWGWFGNTECKEVHLATIARGRIFVLRFHRWGMKDAQPMFQVPPGEGKMVPVSDLVVYERDYRRDFHDINHPDARFLADSWEYVRFLLERVELLEVLDELHATFQGLPIREENSPQFALNLLDQQIIDAREHLAAGRLDKVADELADAFGIIWQALHWQGLDPEKTIVHRTRTRVIPRAKELAERDRAGRGYKPGKQQELNFTISRGDEFRSGPGDDVDNAQTEEEFQASMKSLRDSEGQ